MTLHNRESHERRATVEMNLRIDRRVYDDMLMAAKRAAPLEACGLCGGQDGHVTRFYELTNVDLSPEHFGMKPEEQFAAVKDMRAAGLQMLAIWHSHPASAAQMSDEDLRLAYTPDTIYLILSLANPGNPDLRGFTVKDGRPVQVAVEISDLSSNSGPNAPAEDPIQNE